MQEFYEQEFQKQQQKYTGMEAGRAVMQVKKSFLSWPVVFLLLGVLTIGGCYYTVDDFFSKAITSSASKVDLSAKDVVGVIAIEGEIRSSTWVTKALYDFNENKNIKAIVIRIDSPGGSVAPCQEIYAAIVKSKKPVIISMGSVAASGGLYIAAAGDHVLANPGTITGSIGVIMQTLEFSGTMEKIGASSQSITSGVYKDTGSPFRKMRADELELLQTMVNETYEYFVQDLANGRPNLTKDEVRRLADGRIYSGSEAFKNGLIDELGGFEDALLIAAQKGGLSKNKRPIIIMENGIMPWWEKSMTSSSFLGINAEKNLFSSQFTLKYIYQPLL